MRLFQQDPIALTSSRTSRTLKIEYEIKGDVKQKQQYAHSIHMGMISHSYVGSDELARGFLVKYNPHRNTNIRVLVHHFVRPDNRFLS